MSNIDVIRAWKDAKYRAQLSDTQRQNLPAHPAGLIELGEHEMENVAGGGVTVNTEDLFFTVCDPNCKKLTAPGYRAVRAVTTSISLRI